MKRFGHPMPIVAVIAVTATLARRRWSARRRLLSAGGLGAALLSLAAAWPAAALAGDRPPRKGIAERMDKAPIRPEGWALELTLNAKVYKPGEDILLTAEFVNRSKVRGRTNMSRWEVNHWLEVESWGGHGPDPRRTALGERYRKEFGSRNRNRNDPIWIGPGERRRDPAIKLNTLYDLDPGYYRVRLTYYDEHSWDGALKLVSDWARFRIAAP
jgi:hypothetical protein